jgi:hypothetical protein
VNTSSNRHRAWILSKSCVALWLFLGSTASCGSVEVSPDGGEAGDSTDANPQAPDAVDAAPQPTDDAGASGPDVRLVEARLSADIAAPGDDIIVTATVRNHGNEAGSISLEFEVDGELEETKSLTVDPPGAGGAAEDTDVDATFTWEAAETGSFELTVNGTVAGTVIVRDALPEGYEIVIAEVTVEPGGLVHETAECRGSRVVIAGGASQTGFQTVLRPLRLLRSAPRGTDGWTATIQNFDRIEHTVRVAAICAGQPPGYEKVTSSASIAPASHHRLSALCPTGKVIFSGGADVGAGPDASVRIHESGPDVTLTHSWFAAVENVGESNLDLTVSAICANEPPGYNVQEQQVSVPAGDARRRVHDSCGQNSSVLGGGVRVVGAGSGNFDMRLLESDWSFLSVLGSDSYGWSAAIANLGEEDRDVLFTRICADLLADTDRVSNATPLPPGQFARGFAECPEDTVLLGGGVRPRSEGPQVRTHVHESVAAELSAVPVWTAAFQNLGASAETVEVVAICAEPPPAYSVETVEQVVSAGDLARVRVDCPGSASQRLSGGARVSGSGTGNLEMRLIDSHPEGDGWATSIVNLGEQNRTVQFAALCAAEIDNFEVVTASVEIPPAGFADVTASCGAENVVIGGGLAATSAPAGVRVQRSAPAGNGWRVAVFNDGDEEVTVEAAAVCGSG